MDLVRSNADALPSMSWQDCFFLLDGVYGNFAGRDASRGMAKQSFEPGKYYLSTSASGYPHAYGNLHL